MKIHKIPLLFNAWINQVIGHFPKRNGFRFPSSKKIEMPEEIRLQENFKSLEVEDIFLVEELTAEDVQFIEEFLEKTNVNLESEANFFFIISTGQMIYLLRKIMQKYHTFLSNLKKIEA